LEECEKANPYYVKWEKVLPTKVLRNLQTTKYENKNDPDTPWLESSNFNFDRENNKVRVVVRKSKEEDLKSIERYISD